MNLNLFSTLSIAFTLVFLANPRLGNATLSSLAEKWEFEQSQVDEIVDNNAIDHFKDKHVLFVGGFGHDLLGSFVGYFSIASEVAKNDFRMTTSLSKTSSWWFSRNVDRIAEEVKSIYENQHKKVILVCHSKGGGECMHLVLRYPELILDHILDRIVLIQASVKGCAVTADEHLRRPILILKSFLNQFVDGLIFLNPIHADLVLKEALQECEKKLVSSNSNSTPITEEELAQEIESAVGDKWKTLSKKLLYVTSVEDSHQLGYLIQAAHKFFCWRVVHTGEGDGLLSSCEQADHRIGQKLSTVQADHLGLIIHPWLGGLHANKQHAFFRALFFHLQEMDLSEVELVQ